MGDIMFYKHLIIDKENEETLYLFIDFNYEFSFDFDLKSKKEKIQTLYEQVIHYIKDKKINFKAGKIFLVVGGLVIGSLFIQNAQYSSLKDEATQKYEYNEQISFFDNKANLDDIFLQNKSKQANVSDTDIATKDETIAKAPTTSNTTKDTITTETTAPATETIQPEIIKPNNTVTPTQPSTSSGVKTPTNNTASSSATVQATTPPVVSVTPPTNSTTSTPVPTTPVPAPAPAPVEQPAPPTPPAPVVTETMVTLYRYNGTVESISLEDYVVGVVGAEMPASFNVEALKAQSVLARTYALKKIANNQVLSDTTSNQVYKDVNQLKSMWGSSFQTYYDKIKSAVAATKDQYLSYNGNYIEAVYHSTSNGQTEDAVAVWGTDYAYLKSVDSHWDLSASSYLRETSEEFSVLSSIIGIDFNATTNIQVISRTASNRINQIQIGDKIYTGIELRTLLGLRSTDFDIKIEGDTAVFVTRGYGHGVGMSQYGANGMAKEGYAYKDILNHYYPGTQLKRV
jgi:stage II sporulation protein D